MLDPVTFLAGFDELSLEDSAGLGCWLDHVIALSDAGDLPMERASVHELAFRTLLWRIEHGVPTAGERDGLAIVPGQLDWRDTRVRTALQPKSDARSLQDYFRTLGTLADHSGRGDGTPNAVAGLAAQALAERPAFAEDNPDREHRLFARLLANALRELSEYLNRLSPSQLSDVVVYIAVELDGITPIENEAISVATIYGPPSAEALVDWLRTIDDRSVTERLSRTSGYALYLLLSMMLRTITRTSVPPELIPDSVRDRQDPRVSDVATFAALLVFSGASFWASNQVLATAAARAVVVFGYGLQLADDLPVRSMLSSAEDLRLLRSLSDLSSLAQLQQLARRLSRIRCEYRTNPELITVLGLLRLAIEGGPVADEDILAGLNGLAMRSGSITALSVVQELVRYGNRFASERIDGVLKPALAVWTDVDVARLCYAHASEFGEVHHRALRVVITDLLISEGMGKLLHG